MLRICLITLLCVAAASANKKQLGNKDKEGRVDVGDRIGKNNHH